MNYNVTGLVSVVSTLKTARPYKVSGKIQAPSLTAGSSANSQVVATVTQNSTTVYTGPADAQGFEVQILAAASDTVTVALTSAAAVDQLPNAVRCTVSIG